MLQHWKIDPMLMWYTIIHTIYHYLNVIKVSNCMILWFFCLVAWRTVQIWTLPSEKSEMFVQHWKITHAYVTCMIHPYHTICATTSLNIIKVLCDIVNCLCLFAWKTVQVRKHFLCFFRFGYTYRILRIDISSKSMIVHGWICWRLFMVEFVEIENNQITFILKWANCHWDW